MVDELKDECNKLRVLELFSGIGGMHYALQESKIPSCVISAADINTIANSVYGHNFPDTPCFNRNIQSFTAKFINDLQINMILMSPPCQPFTRNGLQKDIEDARTCSFMHILSILSDIKALRYVLVENVKGFEDSQARDNLVSALNNARFNVCEYLLSPTQFGVPNSRLRYYCIAKKQEDGVAVTNNLLSKKFPDMENVECFNIASILEQNDSEDLLLPDKLLLRRARLLDICSPDDTKSNCFTKAYTHFVEGTGSVFTPKPTQDVADTFERAKLLENDFEKYLTTLKSLQLRYFSPREVARLMSFPEEFEFPPKVTRKQCYRLLGNSINVKVVSRLIQLLVSDKI